MCVDVRQMEFYSAIVSNNLERVKTLLDQGEDANACWYHRGPLGLAIDDSMKYKNPTQMVELLLEGGADINQRYQDGRMTPLIHASMSGYVDIVNLLIGRGVDVFRRNYNDKTALQEVLFMLNFRRPSPYIPDTPERRALAENHQRIVQILETEMDRAHAAYNNPRNLAFAMGNHCRIGELSRLASLDPGVIQMIAMHSLPRHRSAGYRSRNP
jgi:hypothetical protein